MALNFRVTMSAMATAKESTLANSRPAPNNSAKILGNYSFSKVPIVSW
jgi:hypothetical protein